MSFLFHHSLPSNEEVAALIQQQKYSEIVAALLKYETFHTSIRRRISDIYSTTESYFQGLGELKSALSKGEVENWQSEEAKWNRIVLQVQMLSTGLEALEKEINELKE